MIRIQPLDNSIKTMSNTYMWANSPDVMKGMHALPLPYMRLFYHTEREVEKLRTLARSRGEELSDLSQSLFDHYGNSNDPGLPELLKGRGLKWFKMALVPALAALLGGGERLLYVTEKNGKDIPGLPEEAVVEKKCMLGPGGTTLLPFHGPAPERDGPLEPFLKFLRKVIRFEEAALAASLEPGEPRVIDALMAHPIATDEDQARLLAPHVLASMSDDADDRPTQSDKSENGPTCEEGP